MSLNEILKKDGGTKASTTQRNSKPKASAKNRSDSKPTLHAEADAEFAGVRLTHPDKVLYPEQVLTKQDLANYYAEVADWMLPHVVDRPLAIVRCPAGSGKACFFQKHPGDGPSDHLRSVNVAEKGAPDFNLADR